MRFFLSAVLILLVGVQTISAQPEQCSQLYTLAPDENNLHQIWRVDLETQTAEMLTELPESIHDYDFTPDGETLVLGTADKLWIQEVGKLPGLLATGSQSTDDSAPSPVRPTISADGLQVAYSDPQGVWNISSEGGEPTLIAENVPYDSVAMNTATTRQFSDPQYIDDTLLFMARGWEGHTYGAAIAGEIYEAELPIFQDVKPTFDGQFLMYSTSRIAGTEGLFRATPEEFDSPEMIFEAVSSLTDDSTVLLNDVVEYEPNRFYLLFSGLGETAKLTLLDYDHETGETAELFSQSLEEIYDELGVVSGISPDGRYLVGILNPEYSDAYQETAGSIVLYEIETGEFFPLDELLPAPMKAVQFSCD